MALRIVEKASRTDVGRQRQSNEDSYLERSPLFVVADGMGGARAGEVASRIAVEAFDSPERADGSPEQQLAEVARTANREIYRMAQADSARAGMGTTFTAALVSGREVAIGHVGDSRLYCLRDGGLTRLTDDHSLVEEFVRQGKLSPEEAEVHPQRSIITRALGPEPEVQVDTQTHVARDGDVYLICSDGLTSMVPEHEVAKILLERSPLAEAADKLIETANAAGGKDNITVVLFRVGADEDAEEESDTLGGEETKVSPIRTDEVRALAGERGGAATRISPREATAGAPRVGATAGAPPRPRARRRPRRRRGAVVAVAVLVLVCALAAGLYVASRQFWFVGTNSRGQVTLYRGLPYHPLGISLYSEQYQSSVPALAIRDSRRRSAIVNHQLRNHRDAVAVIRQLEQTESRP